MLGLDFAWSKPSVEAIKAGGYGFVCRYHSYDTAGKNLTKAEADSYLANGILIVSNWEYTTDAALKGYTQGVQDATEGNRQQAACGGPPAPIYFSVDFDATEAQQSAINSYLQGAASVIGLSRVGVYGGYYVVKRCFDARVVTYGWQTFAWSGGQWDSRAQARQIDNGVNVGGADCDIDQSMTVNFGQWFATGPAKRRDRGVTGIILQDAHSIVLLYQHPTTGQMVYTNIVSGNAIGAWQAAGWGGPFIAAAPLTINDFGTDVNAVNAQLQQNFKDALAGIPTGGGGGGGSNAVVDHVHEVSSVLTGLQVPPTP